MPIGQNDLELEAPEQGSAAGATVQLGADFLSYARERFDASRFKAELIQRLLPTVPIHGQPRVVRPGTRFGKFELEEPLGKGGMAEVYQAIDLERATGSGFGARDESAARVALKVMKAEIALDPEYVRRFLREAANTALIDHPNVVRVHEVGSVEGRLYFTMELIEGETLKDHLKRGPLLEEEGIQILCQLVDGLVAAHERGIGHRDLKPSNIMLVTDRARYGYEIAGEFDVLVKVTDFGLAHMIQLDQSTAGAEGRFLGTAKYVAPEVVRGGAPTLRSDVFSLGILAFQMFAGRAPFHARNKIEYLTANLNAPAPLLHEVVPVSQDLSRLVDAMLGKEPEQRPDAHELRRDLARLKARRGREPALEPAPAGGARGRRGAPPSRRAGAAAPRVLPPWAAAAAAGLAAVLTLGGLLAVFTRSGAEPASPGERTAVVPPPGPELPADPPPSDPAPLPDATPRETTPGDPREATPVEVAPVEVGPVEIPADPLARAVATPPAASFRDALAPVEFGEAVARGDAAWDRGETHAALEAWSRAASLTTARVPALLERLLAARRDMALEAGARAETEGRLEEAILAYEAALRGVPGDPQLTASLAAARARQRDEAALTQGIAAARTRAPEHPGEAVAALRELAALARALGREAELEQALAELGASPATDPAPEALERDVAHLLERTAAFLREGSLDAAELALRRADERLAGGSSPSLEALRARLAWARATPSGAVYLELAPEPGSLRALHARDRAVSNAEYAAWFAEAAARARGPLRPPRAWAGRGQPPAGSEHEPVRGVREEEAAAFAAARGERLPDAAERAALAARLGVTVPGPTAGRYEEGFFTVRAAEEPR